MQPSLSVTAQARAMMATTSPLIVDERRADVRRLGGKGQLECVRELCAVAAAQSALGLDRDVRRTELFVL